MNYILILILFFSIIPLVWSLEYESDLLRIAINPHTNTNSNNNNIKNITVYTREKRYDRYALSLLITNTKKFRLQLVYFEEVKIRIVPTSSFEDKHTSELIDITRVHKTIDSDYGLYYFTFIAASKVDDLVTSIEFDSDRPFAFKIRKVDSNSTYIRLHPNYFNTTLLIIH